MANATCSERLTRRRKNTASAEPTSRYWIGCTRSLRITSTAPTPTKVRAMKSSPYLVARSARTYGLTGSMKETPKVSMQPSRRVCRAPLRRAAVGQAHGGAPSTAACGAVVASALSCQRALKPASPTWRSSGRKRPANDGCGQSDASVDAGAAADRRERELAGADQLDADLGAQRPVARRRTTRRRRHGSRADARRAACRRAPAPRRRRSAPRRCARRANRRARRTAPALRTAAASRRARACGTQRGAVVPGRDQARLQDVAVDLEDAAIARLDRDVALDVERRRRRAQHELAPLGDRLALLPFARHRLPGLAAIAGDDRADQRLARRRGWRRRCARPPAAGPRARRRCR